MFCALYHTTSSGHWHRLSSGHWHRLNNGHWHRLNNGHWHRLSNGHWHRLSNGCAVKQMYSIVGHVHIRGIQRRNHHGRLLW